MLEITPQATAHIRRVRQERGLDDRQAARFVRHAGKVGLTFAESPHSGDLEVDAPGIQVFLAPDVAEHFGQAVLDAREEDGRWFLVVRPAQARHAGAAAPGSS